VRSKHGIAFRPPGRYVGEVPRRAKVRPEEPGREKILQAGLELFGERGYEAASIAEIGERAEIAKSVLYHYFPSKGALYGAIIEVETRELLERVAAAVPDDPAAPRLAAGVDAYLEFLAARPATWRLFLRDAPSDPALRTLHEDLARARTASLATLLATPDKRARESLHVDLVATGIRAFAAWWYEHQDVPKQSIADAILDFAVAGANRT
jgi:AcrR family transcriptional regulator